MCAAILMQARYVMALERWRDVAHGCVSDLHPAKAYAWELRLWDEIRPLFDQDTGPEDQSDD